MGDLLGLACSGAAQAEHLAPQVVQVRGHTVSGGRVVLDWAGLNAVVECSDTGWQLDVIRHAGGHELDRPDRFPVRGVAIGGVIGQRGEGTADRTRADLKGRVVRVQRQSCIPNWGPVPELSQFGVLGFRAQIRGRFGRGIE